MKCLKCEKNATFHITELAGGEPQEVHLCEECAREYLSAGEEPAQDVVPALAGILAEQLAVGQTAEELARLDQQACPICGISFLEFRKQGRLGCPHDYTCFAAELEPLLTNIHGETQHVGKIPKRSPAGGRKQTRLIRLRREMKEAVAREEYEQASKLRDEIRLIEESLRVESGESSEA